MRGLNALRADNHSRCVPQTLLPPYTRWVLADSINP